MQIEIELTRPVIYLITDGRATNQTWVVDCERILALIRSAIAAQVTMIQIREKNLSARALFELSRRAAELIGPSSTKLLVNDRADIACAAGADGVHLTSSSIEAEVVRGIFGTRLLIGVSTHRLVDARLARDHGADFAVLGPVFETPSKLEFGPPLGTGTLREVALALDPFLIIALGGITRHNAASALKAGAGGIGAIRAFSDPDNLGETVQAIRSESYNQ
jgi:thiamine-phosphate pyrophosphorylase